MACYSISLSLTLFSQSFNSQINSTNLLEIEQKLCFGAVCMAGDGRSQPLPKQMGKLIVSILSLFLLLILFNAQTPAFSFKNLREGFISNYAFYQTNDPNNITSKIIDSVTFLPLKDLRFAETAMEGHTWFLSSLNDTYMENEAEHLYFPSQASKGRLLCVKGRHKSDGTKNSYAMAWREALPESAILLEGTTFVSDTYYDYENLWHGLTAVAPFVGWSIKNDCLKPRRWVLFHWGELRIQMGSWLTRLASATFGEVPIEAFEKGDGPYCFEKAVVMRHNEGRMGKQKRLEVFDLLRCKAREFCGIDPAGRTSRKGEPLIRLTLLMRKGSRSFKNSSLVTDIFARECGKVDGCLLKVAQSEDLSFCDQVKLLTHTDIVASPHGAQLTNMLFMNRNSSIMEFFPKGWLELAGIGQYAHHWMADQSGMKHEGAWWDPHSDEECPTPNQTSKCFNFYKDGQVGHNQTFFAEWTRNVISRVMLRKIQQLNINTYTKLSTCSC